ncbi:type II secretion system protein [Rubellimicrobium aerolatum]|uniref:Type II secretion system protein n=1 Tax=Rubellimicrobium aerolatum TaxID=490979 RepID=A0ABW0SCN4_9RHOB|nr:type II secretion system protein [Rubellimicrobium aerolatum]MBP1806168.1 general secretion pathway protein I [Rubellimicrobium aerolatum]
MTWPSDPPRRPARRGFTLIEALVAMAILALLVGTALSGVSWTLGQSADRADRAWLAELARSVADEYLVTRDPALAQGSAAPDLLWRLTEAEPSADLGAGLVEVTVSAWRDGREDRPVTLRVLLREDGP